MQNTSGDPKAGERAYYAALGEDGIRHAVNKPFSDEDCGRYLVNLGAVLQMIGPGPRSIIDFGCGTGWTSLFLARAGHRVLGVDISEDAVELARSAAAPFGLERLEFRAADYEAFEAGEAFDCALFYDALHHADDEHAAMATAFRCLKPGGVLIVIEPGGGHGASEGARAAVDRYGVHEKDMPPRTVMQLGRRAGFVRFAVVPLPHEWTRAVYRRDYLRARTARALWLERAWGYFRAVTLTRRLGRAGLVMLWKPEALRAAVC